MEKQDHHKVAQDKKEEKEHSCYSVVASGDNKEVPCFCTIKIKSKKMRYIICVATFSIIFCIGFFYVFYYLLSIQSVNSQKNVSKRKVSEEYIFLREYKGSCI